MIRNEGMCGFAPEGTDGKGICVGAWSQHPGKRNTVRAGKAQLVLKQRKLFINF